VVDILPVFLNIFKVYRNMAKVQPEGRMRPSDLFLRHLDLFLLPEIWSKAVNKKDKIFICFADHHINLDLFLYDLFDVPIKKNFYLEVTHKWIVRPAMKNKFQIWHAIKKVWPPLVYSDTILQNIFATRLNIIIFKHDLIKLIFLFYSKW